MNKKKLLQGLEIVAFGVVPFLVKQSKNWISTAIDNADKEVEIESEG